MSDPNDPKYSLVDEANKCDALLSTLISAIDLYLEASCESGDEDFKVMSFGVLLNRRDAARKYLKID